LSQAIEHQAGKTAPGPLAFFSRLLALGQGIPDITFLKAPTADGAASVSAYPTALESATAAKRRLYKRYFDALPNWGTVCWHVSDAPIIDGPRSRGTHVPGAGKDEWRQFVRRRPYLDYGPVGGFGREFVDKLRA
jgi:hypothetical protein